MLHEFPHHIDKQLSKLSDTDFSNDIFYQMAKDGNEIDISSMSRYVKSNYEKHYDLGEAFAEIMTEAYGPTLGKQALMFKKYFEKKALEVINDASSS